MHRILTTFLLAAFFTSCAPLENAGETASGKSVKAGDIFYASQADADAALDAFDRDNLSCQLWTNWQKMCSRTGEGGTTWCTTDPDRPVRPSVPFCSAFGRGSFTSHENKSAMRHCKRKGRAGTRDRLPCAVYEDDRPFNGRRVAARRHPFCNAWSEQFSKMQVCVEGHRTDYEGSQNCRVLAKPEIVKESYNKLYCSNTNSPLVRSFVREFGPIKLHGFSSAMDIITHLPQEEKAGQAVIGIFHTGDN